MAGFEYRSDDIKATLPMPERFNRTSGNGEVHLTWRWFNNWLIPGFLLFWLLMWWSFLLPFLNASGPGPNRDVELTLWESWFETVQSLDWWASIFPIPLLHILAGIVVIYVWLAVMINKTTLSMTSREIKVRHYPLPWYNRRPIALSTIDSFFPRQYTVKRHKGGRQTRYSVAANLPNDEFIDVIKLRSSQAQLETEFLAQELNNYIQDHQHL